MSSSRLPGKMLMDIRGRSVLEMVLSRLSACGDLAGVWVATSGEPEDDSISDLGQRLGTPCFRGSLPDVLDRSQQAAAAAGADAIVRITADCPLVDPAVVDLLVQAWRNSGADYVANTVEPRSFPNGLDVEVISRAALDAAARQATNPADREHVTAYLRDRPEVFAARGLWMTPPMDSARVTVDTAEDLTAVRDLVGELGHDPPLRDLLKALGGPAEFELLLGESRGSAARVQPAS